MFVHAHLMIQSSHGVLWHDGRATNHEDTLEQSSISSMHVSIASILVK